MCRKRMIKTTYNGHRTSMCPLVASEIIQLCVASIKDGHIQASSRPPNLGLTSNLRMRFYGRVMTSSIRAWVEAEQGGKFRIVMEEESGHYR